MILQTLSKGQIMQERGEGGESSQITREQWHSYFNSLKNYYMSTQILSHCETNDPEV